MWSYRAIAMLLCISTVVIAQVPPLPPGPSPSIPESIEPAAPVSEDRKPTAPTGVAKTVVKSKRIRFANRTQSETAPVRHYRKVATNPDTAAIVPNQREGERKGNTVLPAPIVPQPLQRTASLENLVPLPRPLPVAKETREATIDRLKQQLQSKQQLLKSIEAEITQLATDIKTLDSPQVVIEATFYETASNELQTLSNLLTGKAEVRNNHLTVDPVKFGKLLEALQQAGQLTITTRPKLFTIAGRKANVEINGKDLQINLGITPTLENGTLDLQSAFSVTQQGQTQSYNLTAALEKSQSLLIQMNGNGKTFIGLIVPRVINQVQAAVPAAGKPKHQTRNSAALVPIPVSTEPSLRLRKVQFLDLNLDQAPVYR